MTKSINVFTDGGSRGNPGPSAIGVYIEDNNGKEIAGFGKRTGIATNNTAEYKAVVEALSWIGLHKKALSEVETINFFLDSSLVCSQINGLFKIKNANLRNYLYKIRELENNINYKIYYRYIPREKNKRADRLVNHALDSKLQLP